MNRPSVGLGLLLVSIALLLPACTANTNGEATMPETPQQQSPPPAAPDATVATPPKPDMEMQAVLDQLAKLGGKPIETLTPEEARKQPTPADAVKALLQSQGKPTAPEPVAKVSNRTFPGAGGAVPIRIYMPAPMADQGAPPRADADKQTWPVVLYIHGGGWVIADLDTYDASARALANRAQAIVVSTHYRQGPEHMFPAAHEDTLAAYQWVLKNAASLGGDPRKIALVGESAGGNMAANIAIAARDRKWQAPLHQVLVYPVADNDLNSPSYQENANAKPLNKAMIEWFVKHYVGAPEKTADPRIALVKTPDLKGVAPATIVLAQIDPLRSDGEKYAARLRESGVPVELKTYDGVAHEFFGMGAAVDKAKQAQAFVGERLRAAWATPSPETD
ncbi:alpha/beta hydrolase [Lysobacter koreensis]|uniref:Alpha/beta hydrolase n=1 Tax=Lysobacter koreensis TaxID=266122 RepID=A0ABW2YPL8_9GAMM